MSIPVNILATCTNPDLIRATTLVFDTLRIGFPTAPVTVYMNHMLPDVAKPVMAAAKKCGADVTPCDTIHPEWIESLLKDKDDPFFICDTDVVFWNSFEAFGFFDAVAGAPVPQFFDAFTNCLTLPRLHTCLMYLDPKAVAAKVRNYFSQFPETPFNPKPNLIKPGFLPWPGGKAYFHDVCCLLYQAIGGTPFNRDILSAFDHLQAGTFSDLLGKAYPGISTEHAVLLDNPHLMRGLWDKHRQFYQRHAA